MKKEYGLIAALFGLLGCAGVYGGMEAEKALRAKDYPTAAARYEALLEGPHAQWQYRIRLAYSYLKAGSYGPAIAQLQEAANNKNAAPWASFYAGLAYLNQGRRAEAIAAWENFRDQNRPLLEKELAREVKRQKMLLLVEESKKAAKDALREEQRMGSKVRPLENSIGIFGYEDTPPNKNVSPFAKALSVMIVTDLSKIEGLKIVERMKLHALASELGLAASGLMKGKTAPRLGRLVQAEKLVAGVVDGEGVTAVTSIASTPKGKVIGSFSAQKPQALFFELEKEIVHEIVKVLGLSPAPTQGTELERYHTRNLKAFMAYGQGFLYFDAEDFANAARQFELALAEDPDFVLAKQALESCPAPEALTSKIGLPDAQLTKMELMMGLPNVGSACGN